MIDNGFNPYIVKCNGKTEFDSRSLSHLTIPEMPKSVYFSIYPDESYPAEMKEPWYYSNGLFPGDFKELIGKGSEGYVISGKWRGIDAAYKFVEIKNQIFQKKVNDGINDLKKRLTEINSLKAVNGSHILKGYGHFR